MSVARLRSSWNKNDGRRALIYSGGDPLPGPGPYGDPRFICCSISMEIMALGLCHDDRPGIFREIPNWTHITRPSRLGWYEMQGGINRAGGCMEFSPKRR